MRFLAAILRVSVRNLLAAPRRALFLGGALFGVTMLFVLLLALTAGVADSLVRAATSVSSGHLNVGGFYKATPKDAQPMVADVTALKAEVKQALPNAVRVIDRVRGFGKIISPHGSVQTGISGVDIDEESAFRDILVRAPAKDYVNAPNDPEAAKGSVEDVRKPRTIILFASQAKRLRVDVGDEVTIRTETARRQVNTADATVVAVVRDIGLLSSFATFVPKDTVKALYRFQPDVSGVVQIYLKDIDDSDAAVDVLRAALTKNGHQLMDREAQPFFMKQLRTVPAEDWTGARLDVTSWEDEASFLTQIISGLRAVSLFLILVLSFVIVVGITNAMTIAVRERTQEIGTLRALGMQRSVVLLMFVMEMVVLGGVSTALGAVVGSLIAAAVDAAAVRVDLVAVRVILLSDTLHLVPRVQDAAVAVLALTAVSTLAALVPALRAARIAPVTAMQHSG